MGGSSSDNSFIPKRGPVSRPRRVASKQIYLFTLVSYVLFFASLVATAGVFLYDRYIDQQLQNEVTALNVEIERFREGDLETVREFDSRIEYTKERVNAAVSMPAIFAALENTTVESAQIETLSIDRLGDAVFEVQAEMRTDTFDSSLFQREFYEQENLIDDLALSGLEIETVVDEQTEQIIETGIAFVATLAVPVASVPFTANSIAPSAPAIAEESLEISTEAGTSTDEALAGDNLDTI